LPGIYWNSGRCAAAIPNQKEDVVLTSKEQLRIYRPGQPAFETLAMAYVPSQRFGSTYSPDVALSRGTLFPELDKPFCGRTVRGGGPRA